MIEDFEFDGETYDIKIDSWEVVKPDMGADNPDDYYGYSELELTVFSAEDGTDVTNTMDASHYAACEDAAWESIDEDYVDGLLSAAGH